LIASKKCSGRHAARLRRDGITARLSCSFNFLAIRDGLDILVAGCGTGQHSIGIAGQYTGARLLAIDLSLTSLCYAKRKTSTTLNIEYAQADILKLGSLNRTFDLVDCAGVLHHLSDTFAGWRALLPLLRPGGVMHVGLYSELARREIVATREFITTRGYGPSIDDIRRARQDIANSAAFNSVLRFDDFYGASDFRDLFIHVQENRHTIPQIQNFIAEYGLKFLGFQFSRNAHQHYLSLLAKAGSSMSDLDRWHAFEIENPLTFTGMYQFWIQKA
jgi:2-polyprenyl-3-methyl-5-hydroxy-6-metoxy-1,4-benzoquinol methylase